jgi:hypothetical protein
VGIAQVDIIGTEGDFLQLAERTAAVAVEEVAVVAFLVAFEGAVPADGVTVIVGGDRAGCGAAAVAIGADTDGEVGAAERACSGVTTHQVLGAGISIVTAHRAAGGWIAALTSVELAVAADEVAVIILERGAAFWATAICMGAEGDFIVLALRGAERRTAA